MIELKLCRVTIVPEGLEGPVSFLELVVETACKQKFTLRESLPNPVFESQFDMIFDMAKARLKQTLKELK